MGRPLAVVLGVTLFAILGQGRNVAAAELLTNGGFEDGTAGWAWSDGTLDTVASAERGGLAGRLSGSTVPTHEVYQFVEVAPGSTYEFSGWILLNDPAVERVFLRVRWFDAGGTALSLLDSPWLVGSDPPYRQVTTGPQAAPPQASSARVGVVVQPGLSPAAFAVLMDDLSLSGPPPSTPAPPTPTPTAAPETPAPPTPTPTPVAGSVVATPAPAAAPLELEVYPSLFNGGFEEGREDGTPLGWRRFGGEVRRSQSVRLEGAYSAAFTSGTTATKWVYQTVAVAGGDYYSLAAQVLKDDPAAAEAFLRLSWYATADGSGSALDSVDSRERLTADSPSFRALSTGTVQAPAEARTAKVRLMLRPLSAAAATVYFDAVTFGPAPAGDGASTGDGGRSGSVQGGALASPVAAEAAAPGGRTGLANVKPSRPNASNAAGTGGGRGSEWPFVALAVSVPAVALAATAAYEGRRRRLAAGDERHL